MKTPPYIQPGSKIRIVAPAGKVSEKYIIPAVQWLARQGYNTVLGQHIFAEHFQFAGTDEDRLQDLQLAFDDPETDVIICARGGYGTIRIIEQLDFTSFKKHPKWIAGFSDITLFHSCLNNLGFASIHGTMPRYFFDDDGIETENLKTLMQLLSGEKVSYNYSATENNRGGNVSAELVGGNLSILCSLIGTKYEPETKGKILFLEDINEYLYHTDRMMNQLKLAGKLEHLAGLVVGDFTNMKDNDTPFGKTIEEIILDAVSDYNFPVAFGFPAGHDKKNLALAFGEKWDLNVSVYNSTLKLG
ncbi:MAG: LD-carboxypeptidase [Prolixibacteraceae bacterium]|nr:LD-carboxypeptidase [Prolixibacteraceae bacterium]